MKIVETLIKGTEDRADGLIVELVTNEVTESVSIIPQEPEDNSIHRDHNSIFNVKSMLEFAYRAGQQGEILQISTNEITFKEYNELY